MLSAGHRKYRTAEEIYAELLQHHPEAGPAERSQLRSRAARSARQAVAFIDVTFSAPKSITVAVLNGTTVTGLAATVADRVEQEGFRRGNTNNALTQGQQAESVVEYSDGNVRAAQLVGKKLGISQVEKIDPQTQGLAGDATVTVIVGADKAGGAGSSG